LANFAIDSLRGRAWASITRHASVSDQRHHHLDGRPQAAETLLASDKVNPLRAGIRFASRRTHHAITGEQAVPLAIH
jgi:hypothetical protein